jgi:hypothetical protein
MWQAMWNFSGHKPIVPGKWNPYELPFIFSGILPGPALPRELVRAARLSPAPLLSCTPYNSFT